MYTRAWDAAADSSWERLGQAQGAVRIPEGRVVKIEVGYEAASDISPLSTLPANAFDTILMLGPNVSNDQLVHIAGLTGLRRLDISSEKLTDPGLEYIAKLYGLQTLVLTNANITDQGFLTLRTLKHLRDLRLDGVSLTDDGLSVLPSFPNLTELTLKRMDVTNQGLVHIRKLDSLEKFTVQSTGMTPEALRLLKYDLEGVEIEDN